MTDSNIALTSMMVWEEMLQMREVDLELSILWDEIGYAEMRSLCLRLAIWAEEVYSLFNDDDFVDGRVAFDFEIVPYILTLVKWTDPLFTPQVEETCLSCMDKFKKELMS